MTYRRLFCALLASASVSVLAGAALADPPAEVGRISDIEGAVSVQPPGVGDWIDAIRNYPVTSGESVWTDDTGRAELQFGPVIAHLDSQTELDVLDLGYGGTRLSIPQGSVDLRVWNTPEGGVVVETPAGEVRLYQPGVFRIDVGEPDAEGDYPPVEVTALEGQAEAPAPGGSVDVPAGSAAILYNGYQPDFDYAYTAAVDDWARQREAFVRRQTPSWLPAAETGADDLGAYGQFAADPQYGEIWYPSDVPEDWAPYRYGQWTYLQPWGWTWIDDQPWGFAPFHYGRWVQIRGRWGWVPGQPTPRPVYAPALVAFIGGNLSAGLSLGAGGALAWVPLGPDELYVPPYQVSDEYVRRVNVTNVSQSTINNITVNNTTVIEVGHLRNAAAVTAIPTDVLARGGRVQQASIHISPQTLAAAHVASPSEALPPAPSSRTAGAASYRSGAAGLTPAAQPPARVQQLHAAIMRAPAGSTAPPVIPGLHPRSQKPMLPAGGGPLTIAPAAKTGNQPPLHRLPSPPNGQPIFDQGPSGRAPFDQVSPRGGDTHPGQPSFAPNRPVAPQSQPWNATMDKSEHSLAAPSDTAGPKPPGPHPGFEGQPPSPSEQPRPLLNVGPNAVRSLSGEGHTKETPSPEAPQVRIHPPVNPPPARDLGSPSTRSDAVVGRANDGAAAPGPKSSPPTLGQPKDSKGAPKDKRPQEGPPVAPTSGHG